MAIWDVSYKDYINLCGESTYLSGTKYKVVESLPRATDETGEPWKVQFKWLLGMRKAIADNEAKKVV
jgi:hypothetical protein